MLKIFIASHAHFASGMKSAIELLAGEKDNIVCFDAYVNENDIDKAINQFLAATNKNDQIVMISDLYGGSVNQMMCKYTLILNVTLISGANLALLLELSVRDSITSEELAKIVENSKSMIRVVNDELNSDKTNTADFF